MRTARAETELRKRLADRARELGSAPRPDGVELRYADVPGLPECTLVAGTWRSGRSRNGITGLVCRGEEPDLRPGYAFVSVLRRWQVAQRPPPAEVAGCLAFLLDPVGERVPLLADADIRGWRALDGGPVGAPDVVTEPGSGRVSSVRFWWQEDAEAREVVVDVDADGRVAVGGGRTAVRDDEEGGRP